MPSLHDTDWTAEVQAGCGEDALELFRFIWSGHSFIQFRTVDVEDFDWMKMKFCFSHSEPASPTNTSKEIF